LVAFAHAPGADLGQALIAFGVLFEGLNARSEAALRSEGGRRCDGGLVGGVLVVGLVGHRVSGWWGRPVVGAAGRVGSGGGRQVRRLARAAVRGGPLLAVAEHRALRVDGAATVVALHGSDERRVCGPDQADAAGVPGVAVPGAGDVEAAAAELLSERGQLVR